MIQESCHLDADVMTSVLQEVGYIVTCKYDLTGDEILAQARKFRKTKHNTYDSFVVYFSGHGGSNVIYGSDLDTVEISEIVNMFQPKMCNSLAKKPKIFLWDCCRGSQVARGAKDIQSLQIDLEVGNDAFSPPEFMDFVYGFSSALGFRSYVGDNKHTGGLSVWTFYLQKHLRDSRGILHLTDLLTVVQNSVLSFANEFEQGHKLMASNHVSLFDVSLCVCEAPETTFFTNCLR
eukprot:TRINITY_DN3823_c0_g1_i1.p1 TRINITY_DN3823_c0_g1~~TRINITY_DN3823_c0_g1_i1.p1  ORF type:complete len:234 (+),score=38.58 TRINITY_DN3823_c0_g1_i1:216-917(+)